MKSGNPIKIIPESVPMCIKALYKQCHLNLFALQYRDIIQNLLKDLIWQKEIFNGHINLTLGLD